MSNLLAARITMPEQVLTRELDGEAVILNLETEKYFSLDEVGTRMLGVLLESDSVQMAIDVLINEYEVDAETLRGDLLNLIQKLKEQGIIETTGD